MPTVYLIDRFGNQIELRDDSYVIIRASNVWTAGVDSDFNTDGNWSLGHVPTDSEVAYFTSVADGGSVADCNASATIACGVIHFSADYTGTFDPNGQDITTEWDLTIASGWHIEKAATDAWEGCAVTVGGDFTAAGDGTQILNLRGGATGWTLSVAGDATANYVNASYCDASGGSQIQAYMSIDSSNNTNWSFLSVLPYKYDLLEAAVEEGGRIVVVQYLTSTVAAAAQSGSALQGAPNVAASIQIDTAHTGTATLEFETTNTGAKIGDATAWKNAQRDGVDIGTVAIAVSEVHEVPKEVLMCKWWRPKLGAAQAAERTMNVVMHTPSA